MKHSGIVFLVMAIQACVTPLQAAECLDAADEPHHEVLYQNADARILLLELPRIANTQPHSRAHSYLYIVTGEKFDDPGRQGDIQPRLARRGSPIHLRSAKAGYSERVDGHVSIVETLHSAQYNPLDPSDDRDLFPRRSAPDLVIVSPSGRDEISGANSGHAHHYLCTGLLCELTEARTSSDAWRYARQN